MSMRAVVLAIVIGVVAAGVLWWRSLPPESVPAPGARAVPAAEGGQADAAGSAGPVLEPEEFRDQVRAFVREAPALPGEARAARADALRADILERERAGHLLPAQSAYLQLALIRATGEDDDDIRRRSQAVLEEYRGRSEAGWQAHRSEPDPRHQAYRAAEAELVRRASAAGEDLSQAELRERLKALREDYYGDGPLQ